MSTYVQQVGKLNVPFACLKELHLIWNNMNIITVRTYFRISVVICLTYISIFLFFILSVSKEREKHLIYLICRSALFTGLPFPMFAVHSFIAFAKYALANISLRTKSILSTSSDSGW
jgi:hypothetical protein